MVDEKSPEEGVDETLKEGRADARAEVEGKEEKDGECGKGEKGGKGKGEKGEKGGAAKSAGTVKGKAAEDEDASETAGEDAEAPTIESLSALLYESETRIAELQDLALRAKADVENMRRRAAREVENAHKYAVEKMTGELLPVVDSLEKAVESATGAKDTGAMGEGVELSLKMFLTALTRVGIERLDPLGEPFDPQFHEAIAMVENPDSEPNSVMEVIQLGYLLNGRLVRAAKVVVVKGSVKDSEKG